MRMAGGSPAATCRSGVNTLYSPGLPGLARTAGTCKKCRISISLHTRKARIRGVNVKRSQKQSKNSKFDAWKYRGWGVGGLVVVVGGFESAHPAALLLAIELVSDFVEMQSEPFVFS